MSVTFLTNLLHIAQEVTEADRGFSVDTDLKVQAHINITEDMIISEVFSGVARDQLQQAMFTNKTLITNNIITDISDAPNTNTNFANLRIVVVLPVEKVGAIYLDQSVRSGIIKRDIVERLEKTVKHFLGASFDGVTLAQMRSVYNQIP